MKPVPEYIKVRSYIYNLVFKSDGGNVRIPSENELCELFSVSRVTVRGALKALVDDRILVTRRGMGTYVNPKYIAGFSYPQKTIGTIRESGEPALNQFSVMIADAVEKYGMYLELLFRPDSRQPRRLVEQARNLDGVIWENYAGKDSRKYAEAFAGSKIPLLLLTREKEQEQDSIFLNKRNEAHQVVHAASGRWTPENPVCPPGFERKTARAQKSRIHLLSCPGRAPFSGKRLGMRHLHFP